MKPWGDRRVVDVGAELLDRQLVAPGDEAIGKVDDLVLARTEDGHWVVTELVVGTAALLPHLPAAVRAPLRLLLRRTGSAAPRRIPLGELRELGSAVHIAARADAASPSEKLVRERLVARIPGAGRAG